MASKELEEKCSNTKTGEEMIALEKKHSKSRRVSFAETTTNSHVHQGRRVRDAFGECPVA